MLYVIGNPIKHSYSPIIHNSWIAKYGIKTKYNKLLVKESEIGGIIEDIRRRKIIGINVTLPYKETILSYLDTLHESARKSGAVNTIYRNGLNKVEGANTDGIGFCSYLEKDLSFDFYGKDILILGAGGSAKGIISELVKREVSQITIMNRTIQSAEKILEIYKKCNTRIIAKKWDTEKVDNKVKLVVNTTSFGMKEGEQINLNTTGLSRSTIFCDIIYNPPETLLLRTLRSKGFTAVNGLGMLIRQAAASFKFWFNIEPNPNDIRKVEKKN